jgi:hypothetical protein
MGNGRIAAILGASLVSFQFAACEIGSQGEAPVLDASVDAGMDAPKMRDVVTDRRETSPDVQDVQEEPVMQSACNVESCAFACCGDQCVRDCQGCDAGVAFCPFIPGMAYANGYCVPSCSGCSVNVTCYSCSSGAAVGTCSSSASECPGSISSGACTCPSGDAGECPGAMQQCAPLDAGLTCVTP